MSDDYEIISMEELHELKETVKELKEQISSGKALTAQAFVSKIEVLSNSIDDLNTVIKTAATQMQGEESIDLTPLHQKLDQILSQNKQIAQAMLTVVDMIEEFTKKQGIPKPVRQTMPQPARIPVPPRTPNTPNPVPPKNFNSNLPPMPPPPKPKKKGFF